MKTQHSLYKWLKLYKGWTSNRPDNSKSMAPSQLGVFAMSDNSYETPNLQFHVQPLSLDKFGDPLHNFPGLTASVCNLNPQSRGSVHITSKEANSSLR